MSFKEGNDMMKKLNHTIAFILSMATILSAGGKSVLLTIGSKAPDFTMASSDGDTVSLGDFAGKNNVVLIFYPGDETPGCTKQLCAVWNDFAAFEAKSTKVFGVNPANIESHRKFIKSQNYQFALLADEGQKTAKLYRCDGWPVVKRTVYAIDKKGMIVYAKTGMPSNDEILRAIPSETKP